MAVICLLLATLGDGAHSALRLEWQQPLDLWRLVTAHVVHLGWPHTLMNLAALVVIAWLFASALSVGEWAAVWLSSAFGVSLGLLVTVTGYDWYVGLSGVIHGLLAAIVTTRWPTDRWESIILGVGLIGKLSYEMWIGALPGSAATAGGPVVTEAHLFGALSGLIAGIAVALRRRL